MDETGTHVVVGYNDGLLADTRDAEGAGAVTPVEVVSARLAHGAALAGPAAVHVCLPAVLYAVEAMGGKAGHRGSDEALSW